MTDPQEINGENPQEMRQSNLEQRDKNRFALLIRSAKLKCDMGEFLCIVRDVSEGGVKLRLFHPLPACDHFDLELASGLIFEIIPVWHKGELAGFRFPENIHVPTFIGEKSDFPKRGVRLNVNIPAIVRTNGGAFAATIRDISREGVGIDTQIALALEQQIAIEAAHYCSRVGTVRWRDTPSYGIALQELLSFETLARTAALMQLSPELLDTSLVDEGRTIGA